MANVAGFAVGVRHVLAAAGWDVDADGLFGAPEITVVVGEERHATVDRALHLLGLGKRHITAVSADEQHRRPPYRRLLRGTSPLTEGGERPAARRHRSKPP